MRANKTLLAAALLAASAAQLSAQSAADGISLAGGYDLRGTARFMSMGGAFGALGGDLSTLTQNPAGLGIYRSSDIGVSMNIDIQSSKMDGQGSATSIDQTKVTMPNLGYVGAWSTGSDVMPYFNWGFTYGRVKSFDRQYAGRINSLNGSLTDYVAAFTSAEGWTGSELESGQGKDPYFGSYAPWMSILFYNGCLINPLGSDSFQGLTTQGGSAQGYANVQERGYVDEYSINLGGNFSNTVFWGLGVGIKDIAFSQWAYWGEDVSGAQVPYQATSGGAVTVKHGSGGYDLDSYKHIWGSGVDVKLGVIYKPINELRLGLAVHTPTWYNLEQVGSAEVNCDFTTVNAEQFSYRTWTGNGQDDYFQWNFDTPWKIIASAAGVIGQKGLVSLDYEWTGYNKMRIESNGGYRFPVQQEDVTNYTTPTSTVRIGAEYRLTPSFSVRAGYVYSSSPTKSVADVNALNASDYNMDTDGPDDTETTPSYVLPRQTQYVTVGIGWKYKMLYLDAAYVHRNRVSDYYAWSTSTQPLRLTQNDNNIVLTAGLRF